MVNTHYHSDHVGGNAGLQGTYGVPVAAHRWEAEVVNRRDPEACSAEWLDQPVEPYWVDLSLSEGDEIDAGNVRLRVLHTPGYTLGYISLWEPKERVLILGDAAHADDVGWINPYREGTGAIERAAESVGRRHREALRAWQRGDSVRLWELCGLEIRSEASRSPDDLEDLRRRAFFGVANA